MAVLDPSLIWASEHPDAGVCDTTTLMPHDEFLKNEYVRWQEDRLGTVHWRVFYTPPRDDLSFAVSLHPPATAGPATIETGVLHKMLFEHMERALRLAARPPDLARTYEAVINLDRSGCVLSMSPRAEEMVLRGDGLTLAQRRLRATTPDATARLDEAIASAATSLVLGGSGGGVRLPRPNARGDWLALVSPCPQFLDYLPVSTPAVVLRVIETESKASFSAAHAELFNLSPREAEVARALLAGHSLESLSAALGISRNTAKAHLNAVFRKTGTGRQSELVHLLANITRE
jgi:DNA-binding CsgD family transcriptional regulator